MKEEKTEISARIAEVIKYLNENSNSFAKKLGYSRAQTVYDILNGKSAPSYDFFNKFANSEYSEKIDVSWLLTGKGLMIKKRNSIKESVCTSKDTENQDKAQDTPPALIEHLLNRITEQSEEIGRLKERIKQLERVKDNTASDALNSMVANAG